jgi:phosphatidylserine/phosphatidylglycerophosphate/cardiolipin synthase-like enzyme
MHLKSYQIDGRLLRTGAANFSVSGLKRQDNDLIVVESAEAATRFKRNFDASYVGGEALAAGAKQQSRRVVPASSCPNGYGSRAVMGVRL